MRLSYIISVFKANWIMNTLGTLLTFFAFFILIRNERKFLRISSFVLINFIIFIFSESSLHHKSALEEALANAITFRDSSSQNPAGKSEDFEGKLIHVIGKLRVQEPLAEYSYNILVSAVKLKKIVQMYQWHEDYTENQFAEGVETGADSRSYYYYKDWNEQIVDSRSFHSPFTYTNPQQMPYQGKLFIAEKAFIENFEIGSRAKMMMDDWIDVTSDTRPDDGFIKMHIGWYYHVEDLFNPMVGDVRVKFQFAGLQDASYTIVGKLVNGKIEPYSSKARKDVILLKKGEMKLDEIFEAEHMELTRRTWYVRIFGCILTFFGVLAAENLLKLLEGSHFLLAPTSNDPLKNYIKISLFTTITICVLCHILNLFGI